MQEKQQLPRPLAGISRISPRPLAKRFVQNREKPGKNGQDIPAILGCVGGLDSGRDSNPFLLLFLSLSFFFGPARRSSKCFTREIPSVTIYFSPRSARVAFIPARRFSYKSSLVFQSLLRKRLRKKARLANVPGCLGHDSSGIERREEELAWLKHCVYPGEGPAFGKGQRLGKSGWLRHIYDLTAFPRLLLPLSMSTLTHGYA